MKISISPFFVAVLAAFCSPGIVLGNIPLTDSFVNTDLAQNNGFELAFASRPMWHFGMSMGNPPCYPTTAFNADGQQHGVNPSPWPDASSGCAPPGPSGGQGNPFPTYYTVSRCGENEIRVAYNLYFQKDGWSNVLIARGHMHDWERIIVVWQRDGDMLWRRKQLFTSHHSGYELENWNEIQNTIDYSNSSEQGGKDKEGAKIYVGWGKHAMFTTRNTGWNDPASQGCSREFRSRDWWYIPTGRSDLVYAGRSSEFGGQLLNRNWGSASSNPVKVEDRVCNEKEGGYVVCRLAGGDVEDIEE